MMVSHVRVQVIFLSQTAVICEHVVNLGILHLCKIWGSHSTVDEYSNLLGCYSVL